MSAPSQPKKSQEPTSRQEIDAAVAGKTVASQFLETVSRRRGAVALRFKEGEGWNQWSWEDLASRVASVAAGLASLGVSPGDRLVMMVRNRPEFHVLDSAALFLGATPISLYNSSSAEQVAYLTSHCGAKLAVAEDAAFLERFLKVRPEVPTLEKLVVIDPDVAEKEAVSYAEMASSPPCDLEEAARKLSPDLVATVIYTSGTTGPPKGVMLSNYNICWTVESMSRVMGEDVAGKRMVSYLPMAHIAERMLSHYQHVIFGTEVTDCPDLNQLSVYLREVRPQLFMGVPRVWEKIYAGIQAALSLDPEKHEAFERALEVGRRCNAAREDGASLPEDLQTAWRQVDEAAFSQVRAMVGLDAMEIAITGAAPIAPEVFDFFRSIGVPLSEIYGLSECCGPMTWERFRVRSRTVGRAIPGSEVKLLEDGEVVSRGGNNFIGYLNDPERTAEALDSEGWLHTGDIGTLDQDGYLRIIDRKKELIITAGGKNISPANLEGVLKSFPLIGQACAVGDGKPYVAALIVLDPEVAPAWAKAHGIEAGSLSELAENPQVLAEVERSVAEANKHFSSAEQIKRFTVLGKEWLPDSDELTPTMKLKRRGVLEKYAAEIEALYG